MKFNQTPHPTIEDHYHIQDLINSQEKRSNDRSYHRDKAKERAERDAVLLDSKRYTVTDFWCQECREDFKGRAVRQIETDWNNPEQRIAFYRSKCAEGHWCIRLITDKNRDGFWMRSKRLALDRGNHVADIIQPFQSGFNMLYGK